MPGTVLTDCKIFMGGYNLSGFHNSVNLEGGVEILDDTRFGTAGTRSNTPGLRKFSYTGNGFWDDTMDPILYARIGAVREVMSFAPVGNVEGDRAFTVRAVNGVYNPLSGEVGALLPFEFSGESANSPLVRGVVSATGSKSATGNTTGLNLGLVAAGKKIYSALHVTTVNATSVVVTVESDDNSGFTTPVTRLTHATMTPGGGVKADWQELSGAIATDIWWRTKWTVVGAGPFVIFSVIGIQ